MKLMLAGVLVTIVSMSAVLADNEPAQEVYKYVGNTFSNKFHRPWCPFEKVMSAHHAIFFHFRYEAIEAGFKPCQYCLPSVVKQVHCVLLK